MRSAKALPQLSGITDIQPLAPDRIGLTCSTYGRAENVEWSIALADLPAFLLQLTYAGELGVAKLGQPQLTRFLEISKLEVLKSDGVQTLVLHLGKTRVPLALTPDQARAVGAALLSDSVDPPGLSADQLN